jgi:hypothetical protein
MVECLGRSALPMVLVQVVPNLYQRPSDGVWKHKLPKNVRLIIDTKTNFKQKLIQYNIHLLYLHNFSRAQDKLWTFKVQEKHMNQYPRLSKTLLRA